jgi:hypothetical protein
VFQMHRAATVDGPSTEDGLTQRRKDRQRPPAPQAAASSPAFFRFFPRFLRTWRVNMRTIHSYIPRRHRDHSQRADQCGGNAPQSAQATAPPAAARPARLRNAASISVVGVIMSRDRTLRRITRSQVQARQHNPAAPRGATRKKSNYVAKNEFLRHNSPAT